MGVSKWLHTERTMGRGRSRGRGRGSPLGIETRFFFDRPAVMAAFAPQQLRFLSRWGGYARRVARNSIKRMGLARKEPKQKFKSGKTWTKAYRKWWTEVQKRPASPPGTPPYTHTGLLKESIYYAASFHGSYGRNVIVGVTRRKMGTIGELHEHGGRHLGKRYPARPFMAPARAEANKRQKQFWL